MRNEKVTGNIPKTTVRIYKTAFEKERRGELSYLHYHDELEFLYVLEGSITATVDDKIYTAYKNDIVFINSGVPHSTACDGPYQYGLLQFRESDFVFSEARDILKYSAKLSNLLESSIRVIKSDELASIIREMLSEQETELPAYDVYIRAGVYKTLGFLYRAGIIVNAEEAYRTREVEKIAPVLSYINTHYNEDITLEFASSMLGFDSSYFCRIFKAAVGATFTEYLNFVRIYRAEKLLSKTSMSILEISEAVGFSSVSYFNRVFKRYRNCSPRYFRTALYANM